MPDAREPYEKPEALPLAESLLRRVQELEHRQETLRAGLLDSAMVQRNTLAYLGQFSSMIELLIGRLKERW